VCAALLALAQSPARAAPEASNSDPLLHMLAERGLLPTAAAVVKPVAEMALYAHHRAAEAVLAALAFLDIPYSRGGTSAETGFDCSGFTRHVFKNTIGLLLPRSAEQQARDAQLQVVSADELKPGDLVFFNTMKKAFSHVGIYVGEGRFVHAPREGAAVRVESMQLAYWARSFNGARRVPETVAAAPASAEAGR
jgi:cell wall-associated NlpC family hydrolase